MMKEKARAKYRHAAKKRRQPYGTKKPQKTNVSKRSKVSSKRVKKTVTRKRRKRKAISTSNNRKIKKQKTTNKSIDIAAQSSDEEDIAREQKTAQWSTKVMSNMRQKADRTTKAQAKPTTMETAGPSNKRSQRSNVKKEKPIAKEKEEKVVSKPVTNGVKQNRRKRKADQVSEKELKKQKSTDENAEPAPQSSDEEVDTMKEQKTAQRSSKVKEVARASKNRKTAAPKAAKTKVAAKRQKALLEVPKLPTISGVLFVVGNNETGQLGLVDVLSKKRPVENTVPARFVDVAAGGMHSVCLTSKGEVYTFGCNDEEALGRPTADDDEAEQTPKMVDIPDVVVKVSAGDCHSAALTENGRVYIWGTFRDNTGIIGLTPNIRKSSIPLRILHNITVVDIASGSEHFVCLSNEGDVYTCGCGETGQLGRIPERSSKGTGRKGSVNLLEPKVVPLRQSGRPVTVDNIWTGGHCTFLKSKTNGAIFAFGLNNYYQIGLPLEQGDTGVEEEGCTQYKPVKIGSFANDVGWQIISGGQHHTLALDNNGVVHSLGRKEYGRLGLGNDSDHAQIPTAVPQLAQKKCIDISSGELVSFSIADDGSLYSWGFGTNHQLGHGNDDDHFLPKIVEGNFGNTWNAFKVSGGGQHTLILANRKGATEEKTEEKK